MSFETWKRKREAAIKAAKTLVQDKLMFPVVEFEKEPKLNVAPKGRTGILVQAWVYVSPAQIAAEM